MYIFRWLFLPVALLYGLIVWLRNKMYEWQVLKSMEFDIPIVAIGNLGVGGTGKTPHVAFLTKYLQKHYQTAILSRGYKRRTSGYRLATAQTTAWHIGDEPMQLFQTFPNTTVAVGEMRALAIPNMLIDVPETQIILLDDAFQHRAVKANLYILLTDYQRLFTRDYLLPVGNLRESRSGYKRADIIIVSKCPSDLSLTEKQAIRKEIKPLIHQKIFFSCLKYLPLYALNDKKKTLILHKKLDVLLICGIAHTKYLTNFLEKKTNSVTTQLYTDHHYFTNGDLLRMKKAFGELTSRQKIVVTTEKDATRLQLHQRLLEKWELPIYCLPIEVIVEPADKEALLSLIVSLVKG